MLCYAVEAELKRREGDQRRALLPLLKHRNLQVRLNAATDTLRVAPEAARRALETIRDTHWMPYAADAAGRLRGLDEGKVQADVNATVERVVVRGRPRRGRADARKCSLPWQ